MKYLCCSRNVKYLHSLKFLLKASHLPCFQNSNARLQRPGRVDIAQGKTRAKIDSVRENEAKLWHIMAHIFPLIFWRRVHSTTWFNLCPLSSSYSAFHIGTWRNIIVCLHVFTSKGKKDLKVTMRINLQFAWKRGKVREVISLLFHLLITKLVAKALLLFSGHLKIFYLYTNI